MSTASLKSERSHSLGSAPSARSSLSSQSAQTQDPAEDVQRPPSFTDIISTDPVTRAVDLLHARIGQQSASFRQELQGAKDELRAEMKQQGDRLEAKIGIVEKSVHARIDDVEQTMTENFDTVDKNFVRMDKNFETINKNFKIVDRSFKAVDQRFNKLEDEMKSMRDEMKSMRDDIHSIMRMLERMQPGPSNQAPPLIVEQPPSTHSHDDAVQRSEAGPSSPRHRQGLSVEASGDNVSLLSSTSKVKEGLQLIRRVTSRLLRRKKGTSQ
ncbi:hypothetical protein L226DRAFT_570659 [Lentinus tigrinus ALCF2SS1-7]|uniref:uncharacterized protein n=1 Tax=Lentinus tigrinus ALCF2SS1-7 TaxID=1328758 RepID=UPI001165D2CD|nr:hypothetical protein L226DRAFT_570659 [Lentinus tigrinus ALCF2SS1-7]